MMNLIDEHSDARAHPARYSYVTFGSYRLIDVVSAYQVFRITHLYSLEGDQQVHRRAAFNRPFASLLCYHGRIPEFLLKYAPSLRRTIPIIFLDYTGQLSLEILNELEAIYNSGVLARGGLLFITVNRDVHHPAPYVREILAREIHLQTDYDEWLGSLLPTRIQDRLRQTVSGVDSREIAKIVYKDSSPMMFFGFRISPEEDFHAPYESIPIWSVNVPDITPLEEHTLRRHRGRGRKRLASRLGIDIETVEFFYEHID